MDTVDKIPVLAFADSPKPYLGLKLHSEMNILFCDDLDQFFDKALNNNYSGLLLEMRKVMKTPAIERNRIFSFASNKPVMRANAHADAAVLLDDPTIFKTSCEQNICENVRSRKRVEVNMLSRVSADHDCVMARDYAGIIKNISELGCFVETSVDLSDNDFIHIKILDLTNKCPIYGAVRWHRKVNDKRYGYGIQFVNIRENQLNELKTNTILPILNAA